MNLSEKLGTGNLFNELAVISNLPFFSESNNPVMNHLLTINFGERELYFKFDELDLSDLAEMVNLIHNEHWQSLLDFKSSEVNPFLSSSNTITETINDSGERTNTNERINKVSGFNSDELVTNDGDNENLSETRTDERIRTVQDDKMNYQIAFNNLSLSQKTNIIKLVLKDIADFLTLSIY